MESLDEKKVGPLKRNNLNTKNFPPLLMLLAGLITMVICLIKGTELRSMLVAMLIAMFIFAIVGTAIKVIADGFNMKRSYDDLLDEEDDEGEIFKK